MMASAFKGFEHKGKRVDPTPTILDRNRPYKPSWMHQARTTWTDRLGGAYGLVGERQAAKNGGRS